MKPLGISQQKYERFYIPLFLIAGCVLFNIVYVVISIFLEKLSGVLPFLNYVQRLDWAAASNSMETASGAFTAVIFVGVIILEVFTNRYFPVVKYFFYNKQCLFIFTYSVSVTIFSYFSTFAYGVLPYSPVLSFILLAFQNILLGLYFVFYIVTWISPSYTIEIIEADIRKLMDNTVRIARNKKLNKDARRKYYLEIKKEIFQFLSYIYAATEDKDRMVVNKAIFSISNILRHYLRIKNQVPLAFFQLSSREKDDKDVAHALKYVNIEHDKLILETKCFALLNDIFNLLISKGRQGPDQICSVLDEYSDQLIKNREFNINNINMIFMTYFKFIDFCLEFKEEIMAVRVLDRMYHLTKKFLITQYYMPEEQLSAEEIYYSINSLALRMKQYTVLFYKRNMTDVLEKVADILFLFLSDIILKKDKLLIPLEETLLTIFLEVDMKPDPSEEKDMSLLNVRVSQALLGSFYEKCFEDNETSIYSERELETKINLITEDMSEEDLTRIRAIKTLTLDQVENYDYLSLESVSRFFDRFKTKVLIFSKDTRFDNLNMKSVQFERAESMRDAIITLNMKKFHMLLIDDIPNLIGMVDMLDLLINYVPGLVKPLLFIEFGNREMEENLHKFTTLKIPFEIKFFDEMNELDEIVLSDQIDKIIYGNYRNLDELRDSLIKFKVIF